MPPIELGDLASTRDAENEAGATKPGGGGLGGELFRVVEEYSGLGDHRTGTEVDAATTAWFASRLETLGAAVELQTYEFDRYAAEWSVAVDGELVPSMPLFYEGVGHVQSTEPAVAALDVLGGSRVRDLDSFTRSALSDGAEAAVLATVTGNGVLCAVNRAVAPGSGLPTVCVSEALGPVLAGSKVTVELDARIVAGSSQNVVGRLDTGPLAETVLITTPLSGWFTCAGERGTGIAIALDLAHHLAARGPVLVVGTSGHELMGFGQTAFMKSLPGRPAAVLHVGASAAAGEGSPMRLARTRWAGGWIGAARRDELAEAVNALDANPLLPRTADEAADPDNWLGEAREWARLGLPMLSVAGAFPLFHSPEDLPDRATSPELLERVAKAMRSASELLRP